MSFRTKDVEDILKPGERYGALANFNVGSNQFRGLGSLFGAGRIGPNVDVIAGGSYRAQSDYKDGNGNVVPNSGSDVATGLGKVTVQAGRRPRTEVRRDHRRLPLQDGSGRAQPGIRLSDECGEQQSHRTLPLQPAGRLSV